MNNKKDIQLKECVILLEPCTPKAQMGLSAELKKVINERNILTAKTKKKFITALDELHSTTNHEDKRTFRKNQALQEILDSEVIYLNKLEIIMEYFMEPIRHKAILSNFEYETLFGSITNIYKVNGELLNELKQDLANNMAKAFTKLAPFFKLYSVYAYEYKECLDLIETLHHRNHDFNKLLVNQESRPEVQSKLSALLIQPIQRIPRYCLLLKQVLDNTLPTDVDYKVLKDSLDKLEEVARHINHLVEERENAQKLLELTRRLKDDNSLVIQPGRKLLREGILVRQMNNKHDKVYIVLMSDILMCCKLKKMNVTLPNSLKCQLIFPLNKCTIKQNANTKMFEVKCQEDSLVMYHEKGTESDVWVKSIEQAIDKLILNRRTLKKGSSARRPARNSNFASYMDYGVSPGVPRMKKRRRSEDCEENVPMKRAQLDGDAKKKKSWSCLPVRLSKRKAIHHANNQNGFFGRDSLFPLRHHFLNDGGEANTCTDVMKYDPNLYIFGESTNRVQRFTFNLTNFFSGIGKSFKRMLGFRSTN